MRFEERIEQLLNGAADKTQMSVNGHIRITSQHYDNSKERWIKETHTLDGMELKIQNGAIFLSDCKKKA